MPKPDSDARYSIVHLDINLAAPFCMAKYIILFFKMVHKTVNLYSMKLSMKLDLSNMQTPKNMRSFQCEFTMK